MEHNRWTYECYIKKGAGNRRGFQEAETDGRTENEKTAATP
jgi:hypothetical protein